APQSAIAPMVKDINSGCGPRMRQTEAMQLLVSYISSIERQSLTAPELRKSVASHVQELLALTMGPTRDTVEAARNGGLRAARLVAIGREIGQSFSDPQFSLDVLSRRLGVTQRYIQMLLAGRDTSFVDEIAKLRLGRAHDMLSSPRYAGMNITD